MCAEQGGGCVWQHVAGGGLVNAAAVCCTCEQSLQKADLLLPVFNVAVVHVQRAARARSSQLAG